MYYDLIVLGGGPGGYLAAERAGQAGLKTLCIEDRHMGGTCLNEGCIPTKTLLHSAKLYDHALDSAAYGVTAESVRVDHAAVIARKERVIKTLVGGVCAAMKASGVTTVNGRAVITGKDPAGYSVKANGDRYVGKNLIIATGSESVLPPIEGLRESLNSGFAVTNRELLFSCEAPKRLVVVGGGVIGLEMASYYQMTGTAVTVVEMMDHIAGPCDKDLVKLLQKNYERGGMRFELNACVKAIGNSRVLCQRGGETFDLEADRVLVALGRRPNSRDLGLESVGVLLENGAVRTDCHMRTNVPDIYAVGDINGKSMLAHTAYREAEVAVHTILGQKDTMSYRAIPSVLYTIPELSSVGLTEEEAKAQGLDVAVVRIPMAYSGRYVAENENGDGIFKLVIDKKLRTVVGAQVLANYSAEFIAVVGIFIELAVPIDLIKKQVFPHPTVAEIIREAACQFA